MSRHNISRVQRRDLVALVRSVLHPSEDLASPVDFDDWGNAEASHGYGHDEGWSRTYVSACEASECGPRVYRVSVTIDGTDCDGRSSSTREYLAAPLARAKRFYLGRRYDRGDTGNRCGRVAGRFSVRRWRTWTDDQARSRLENRDYRAEAAGY